MRKLIKVAVKQIPQIRRLLQERQELASERDVLMAHLVRLNREMAEQKEELQAHLKRLNSELDASSSALGAITAERDKIKDHLEQLIREHFLLDPQKNPNFSYYLPGQFYSPIPSLEEVKRDEQRIFHEPRMIQGVNLNLEGQLQLLQSLTESFAEFPFQNEKIEKFRFSLGNPNFGGVDAVFLYAVIRHVKPRKVIEIGSGYSSALMLDMSDLYFEGGTQFTFVEPYPELLRSILTEEDKKKVEIIPNRVQDVSLDKFSSLAEGDILFVDSSHVCKVGSDVNTLFFEILPSLASGVYVHIHDIFFPFEYPTEWIYEGRAWNEAYLLRAFLQYNPTFKIVLFNALVAKLYEEELRRSMPVNLDRTGGIWLMKC